jgi:hypothetical protein
VEGLVQKTDPRYAQLYPPLFFSASRKEDAAHHSEVTPFFTLADYDAVVYIVYIDVYTDVIYNIYIYVCVCVCVYICIHIIDMYI